MTAPQDAATAVDDVPYATRARDAVLLREAQVFALVTANVLETLLPAARGYIRQLARTETYRAVAGRDEASKEPLWDLVGSIEIRVVPDLVELISYLRARAQYGDAVPTAGTLRAGRRRAAGRNGA